MSLPGTTRTKPQGSPMSPESERSGHRMVAGAERVGPQLCIDLKRPFHMRERVTRDGWKADIWPCLSGRQGCAESRHF
jgi:hypothetical protein